MVKHLLSAAFACLLPFLVFSQGQNNIWYFADSCGLDFNTNPPTVITHNFFPSFEGMISVADDQGNFLFYSTQDSVWDSAGVVMPNGWDLQGQATATTELAVRSPGNSDIYYLFKSSLETLPGMDFVYFSRIDMSLNNGKGAVTLKNQILMPGWIEKFASTMHANGHEKWLIVHEAVSDKFRSFKITCNGIDSNYVSSQVGFKYAYDQSWGYLKVSGDGRMVVAANRAADHLELFKFDAATGVLSSPLAIPRSKGPYGVEFSPNGNYLYCTTNDGPQPYFLFQYDLSVWDSAMIYASRDSLQYAAVGTFQSGALQLGPDDKIYHVRPETDFIAVINKPDSALPACQFVDTAITFLAGAETQYGLPMPLLYAPEPGNVVTPGLTSNPCTSDSVMFTVSAEYIPDSVTWNFADPSSGPANFASGDTVYHSFAAQGSYGVLAFIHRGCRTDTVIYPITVDCDVSRGGVVVWNVVVYPNPAHDELVLKLGGIAPAGISYSVLDMQGRKMVSGRISGKGEMILDLENYRKGLYLISFESNGQFLSKLVRIE